MKENNLYLDVVYENYSKGIPVYDPIFEETQEYQKLLDRCANPIFQEESITLLCELRNRYGKKAVKDVTLFSWGNPCYHFRINLIQEDSAKITFVVLISIISDFYYIYKSIDDIVFLNPIEEQDIIEKNKLIEIIETFFTSYNHLDPLVANKIIPDVAYNNKSFGELKVLHCLFTDHIY